VTVELREWSWSALVKALDNDEERAFAVLERMPGLGTYEDEVHPLPTWRRNPIAVREPRPRPAPRTHCPQGHLLVIKNGYNRHGEPKLLCGPCSAERRKARQ
jgi:hypothetical protein